MFRYGCRLLEFELGTKFNLVKIRIAVNSSFTMNDSLSTIIRIKYRIFLALVLFYSLSP